MGLRSEDWLGVSSWATPLLPWLCVLGHCHAGIPIHDSFSMPWLASMPWPWRYMALSIVYLMRCSCPVSLAEKAKHNVSTSMFDGGWWCSWGHGQHSSSSKHGELIWCQRAGFWSHLTKHLVTNTQFSSESLANFRRACTCAFLSRGTLRALQDFSPSWCSVTNCFLGDYGPSCLEIIDKILPCSSGLIPHRSYDHWNSTRWDLAWSPSPREIENYFVFLPFASNCTKCCHLLTKLLDGGLVVHSSLV